MSMELIGAFAAGLAVAGFGVYWQMKARFDSKEAQFRMQSDADRAVMKAEMAMLEERQSELEGVRQALETAQDKAHQAELEQERLKEQMKALQDAKQEMKHEFEALANRILEEKSKKFAEQNQTSLGQLLNPLREQMGDFRKKIEVVYLDETKERVALKEQIEQLMKINQQVSTEANQLANALRGDNKAQGDWGEMILETVLQKSGLREGQEYESQTSFVNADGARLRPDVVVHLPGQKDIIIDSKVSLKAYEESVNAIDEATKISALKRHVASLKAHIDGLAKKEYSDMTGSHSLDFILLFVPIESAFNLALEAEPDLFTKAFEKRILVVTPTTLLATLRTIEHNWRFQEQSDNALKIAEGASKLYDKFVGFSEDMMKIGKEMDKAKSTYDEAMKKLSEGRGNLVRQTENLKALGVKAKKQIDTQLLDNSPTN